MIAFKKYIISLSLTTPQEYFKVLSLDNPSSITIIEFLEIMKHLKSSFKLDATEINQLFC